MSELIARPEPRTEARPRAPHVPCPFVLVTGGKGGVGKSTLAANLGVELARAGTATLLVDLDLGLANLDVLLRLPKRRHLEDFLTGDASLEDCVVEGPEGVHVLPAASGNAAMARPDDHRQSRLLDEVARLAGNYEMVLGDTAAGIGADVLSFAAAADRVLVVTTPEPAALADAYGVLKALDAFAVENEQEVATPELVVNLTSGAEEARRVAKNLGAVCTRFLARSPRLVGWIPRSRGVLTASLAQRAFVQTDPSSPASRAVRGLAERLVRTRVPVPGPGPGSAKGIVRHGR